MGQEYIASIALVLLGIIVGFIFGLFTGLLVKK